MAQIPSTILAACRRVKGLVLRSCGKVRDTYELPGFPGLMLVVATDRISIFDFVLNALVALKGEVLTALNVFWRLTLGAKFPHDLVAYGASIDRYLPEHLRNDPDLQKRAVVVRKLSMLNAEGIVRGYLTGSSWDEYCKGKAGSTRDVYGYALPDGLFDGYKLNPPLFTPTNKAEKGHDLPIPADSVPANFRRMCVELYLAAREYALKHGIIIADTKFEGNEDALGDEWLTPDSSRYWTVSAYEKARVEGRLPASLDKQFVRNYGKKVFIDKDEAGRKRDPEDANDLMFVHATSIPDEMIRMTTGTYRYASWRIMEMKLERFQREFMGINVSDRKPNIEVVIGSKSDLPQTAAGLQLFEGRANVRVSVLSCDRNPEQTRQFAKDLPANVDVIIAGAGMSARLPGALKSWLCEFKRADVPVIGVGFSGKTPEDKLAAILAIDHIPGQPVELDSNGNARLGVEGFFSACRSALEDEFLPKKFDPKPAEIGFMTIS